MKDHIAFMRLNRPEKLNALNPALSNALNDTWTRFEADPNAWVAILSGAGRAFCAGADLTHAGGNLYVSNSSSQPASKVFDEFVHPTPNGALVRIRPDGRGEVVATGIYFANGTAIDPHEDAVYVLESSRYDCVRIAIKKDGTFGKPEVYASGFPAIPDGMAFDVNRNLYITLPGVPQEGKLAPMNKIIRVDTSGTWELLIDDPAGTKLAFPTNCAFGGPDMQDLYIANLEGDHFNRVRLPVRGHPLYHQR